MKIITKSLSLSKDKYFEKHLAIINPLLPEQMTNKEIEVIAAFLTLEGELGKHIFSTTGRKLVRDKLQLSNGGLSNYIKALKIKNFILEDNNGELFILDILKPERALQGYQFKLKLTEDGPRL